MPQATTTQPTTIPATQPSTMPSASTPINIEIGKPLTRVDGRLKVTGAARYAAEVPMQGMTHAVLITSTISNGKIQSYDTAAAEKAPGVLLVVTPLNLIKLGVPKAGSPASGGLPGEIRQPLSNMTVAYGGQAIAAVVAETLEQARFAASLVRVTYAPETPVLFIGDLKAKVEKPPADRGDPLQTKRGDMDAALRAPDLTIVRQTYTTPVEHHNPMEMSATTASWEGESLTVWDATQSIMGTRTSLASAFGVNPESVRVLCPFVGGGFGCKGSQWPHIFITAALAKMVNRPVKLMLTRQQMFTSVGHRPPTVQAMTLGATADGKLVAIGHESRMHGSPVGRFIETCGQGTSRITYRSPNALITHTVDKVNVAPPTYMRAPGEASGSFALESAMDELATALKIDPIELRVINHPEKNPNNGKPWSTNHTKECYARGAEMFGWSKRNPTPGSMKNDRGQVIGWGMAAASYPGNRFGGSARIRLMADGDGIRASAGSATHDLGTGAYTIFTQITADIVGLPVDRVQFELGDSTLPPAPVAGGSNTTASVGQALVEAGTALKTALLKLAAESDPASEFAKANLKAADVTLKDGMLASKGGSPITVKVASLIAKTGKAYVEGASGAAQPGLTVLGTPAKDEDYNANQRNYTIHSFGAHFVEVVIDGLAPRVRVTRVVSVMDIGKVINPKMCRSQVIGGVVWGIGQALMEETHYHPLDARPVNTSLAEYLVPVNADVPHIETDFIDIPDYRINALGARGVGEIGITGVAAAIANAVFHATGKRVRELPITPDKLL